MSRELFLEELGDLITRDISSEEPGLPEVLALLLTGEHESSLHKLRALMRDVAESRMRRAA